MKILNIYTDGACSGNQNAENLGGWGAILEFGEAQKELYGGEANTTNNRMEMLALIAALEAITKDHQKVRVFSDSSYLIECFRKGWYKEWRTNGWKTKAKKPVENRDLWERLLVHLDKHDMSFYRVKGHVNLKSRSIDPSTVYDKFVEWNGSAFTYDDFAYITEKNHRADLLANNGIDELRQEG
jgi:ribonuclease HI